jgi:hypothetical protein
MEWLGYLMVFLNQIIPKVFQTPTDKGYGKQLKEIKMANPTKKASPSRIQAINFFNSAQDAGFDIIIVNPNVVRIISRFAQGDKDAYSRCDMTAFGVLENAPLKGGSIWGTDGASIGGAAGLMNGQYVLNKSGEGKRFMNELKKVIGGVL